MVSRIFFISIFILLANVSSLMAEQRASAIDVYSGGKRYASFDAYHTSEALGDFKNDPSSGQVTLFENSLVKVDLAKVKTVTIHPDGTKKEQIGPDGLKEDISGRPKPLVETGSNGLKEGGERLSVQADILNLGRVAGIEPAFKDILAGFDQETAHQEQASSLEDIRRDLESRMGTEKQPILIVSDHKKARVLELRQDSKSEGVLQQRNGLPEKP